MAASYVIGIDLGTSNCAVAFARVTAHSATMVEDFPIPQLQRPGQVATQSLLPSCLYIPGEHELPPGSTTLPWTETSPLIAGEFARWQGARVPGRLVASAKSWLCHAGVDRTADILPWGVPADIAKISPMRASALLLAHLAQAWNAAHPEAPMAEQEVVIAVPASFDEVARALTVSAAREAGLATFTLVEEPQAAFYAFTARHADGLARALAGVSLVLVADVGGGTTDFSLIQVTIGEGGPVLRRVAVGDHLLLGGDNMDAALARRAEERLQSAGHKLSATQWTQLLQAARLAKESLLGPAGPEQHGVAVAGAQSRLVGGTLSTTIDRVEAEQLVLEGFFPFCAAADIPRRAARGALQELGLPYAQDTAIPRHLAAFLAKHAGAGFDALGENQLVSPKTSGLPRPDAILLNGGVFNSPRLAGRFIDTVSAWWPAAPRVPLLRHDSLELAVARGAAFYGLVRHGLGRRIGGGAAQAFYVGLSAESGDFKRPAVCVIPRGLEEGQTVAATDRPFTLAIGQPVQFPLYSTTGDRVDLPGHIVEIDDSFLALPPLHTLFKTTEPKARQIPVHLRATLTELGTLELWCVSNLGDERWRLEFELRQALSRGGASVTESMPARFGEVRALVEKVYGVAPQAVDLKEVKQLGSTLEAALGPRETWRLPLLREIWSTLLAGANKRRRSAVHERVFFRLLGYSLRPGFGYPLDEWRCEQTFRLFAESVNTHGDHSVWNEFWICWRRVAGGLSAVQQFAIWEYLKPHLARQVPSHPSKNAARPKGIQPQGFDEMTRTAAALEHLPAEEKSVLGNWIADRLGSPAKSGAGPWAWSLGRLGARVPLYGSSHETVKPEQAEAWLTLLLDLGLKQVDGAPFAATQLARLTGDRTRDLEAGLRARTRTALASAKAPERWLQVLENVEVLQADDEARALGDTLPIGLELVATR
jgi:molecular chaperone DnaK (HSP70)